MTGITPYQMGKWFFGYWGLHIGDKDFSQTDDSVELWHSGMYFWRQYPKDQRPIFR